MKPETKILLDEYKTEFKSYKAFLDKNDWISDVMHDSKGVLYSGKLNTEFAIVDTILKSMTKFKADVGDDISLKVVKDFIASTVVIIKKHLSKIDTYRKNNPLDEMAEEEDFNFQTKLFSNKTKSKVALTKLNIDEDDASKKSLDLFYGNAKAPLIMREYLCNINPDIKKRTDALGIDFITSVINPATSNEMFINMKEKDIPKWDVNKHFFEQPLSTIQFWEEEYRKICNGVNVFGYNISPFLYWHLNHFKLAYGAKGDKGAKQPLFRDNEYFFDQTLIEAENHGRVGAFFYGSRRWSKSVNASSKTVHSLLTIPKAQGTIQGYSEVPDLKAIIDYIGDAVENLEPALRVNANNMDLKEGAVLGLKGKRPQDRYDFSRLSVVNLEGGNTKKGGQKTAGSTPDVFIFDEALHKDEKLVTDNGFIRIEDVEIGDSIYDHTGNMTTVLDKIDVGIKQLYKVELRNGASIEACGDHLWEVRNKFNNGKLEVKTTSQLIKDFKVYGGRSKYSIRKTKPVNFSEKALKIEPYFLGLHLGDGDKNSATITSIDTHIMDYVENYAKKLKLGFNKTLLKGDHRKTPTYAVRIKKIKGKTNPILTELRKYGTYDNKRIPKEYLYNSVENRLELLRGIMDTDGFIGKGNVCEISQVKKDLFDDIVILLESLGISVKKTSKLINGKEYHKAVFNTSLKVFNLPRKLEKQRKSLSTKGQHNREWVSIENVELTRKDQAYCIKVDNKEKLFLTSMFTVTHNCGKGDCITPWKAAIPSFAGGKGGKWRLVPMLFGTPGDEALSADAEIMLKNPDAYSIMPMNWDTLEKIIDPEHITWHRDKFGIFLPAQMSLEAPDKIEIPFSKFLKDGEKYEGLDNISIHVTDWQVANKFFSDHREKLSSDLDMLSSYINSFPLEVEDCYMTSEVNKFPGLLSKRRKKHVEEQGLQGQKVWLEKYNGEITARHTNDPIIKDYPFKGGNFDAPIVIIEDPYNDKMEPPPLGLYCMGLDDIKHDKSSGDSVISVTVFKRSYEGGEWANRIVAYYDSRPPRKADAYKNIHLLMKYYNARVLFENEDEGFLGYLETHHMDDIYIHLSDGIGLASQENITRNQNRRFGWSPHGNNVNNLENTIVMYTKEDNVIIGEETGLNGIDRINHPMLLEEFYKYKKGANADRIRSFGLALKLARYYDTTYSYMKVRKKQYDEETTYKSKKKTDVKGFTHTTKLVKF